MSLDNWELLLRGANSEAVVIQIVRDYLAQLTPDDYEKLPSDCRPRVATGADVPQWAVHLTRCELKFNGDADAASLLRELVSVFYQASSRIAQLAEGRG